LQDVTFLFPRGGKRRWCSRIRILIERRFRVMNNSREASKFLAVSDQLEAKIPSPRE
jgi:hypothetical protein